MLYITSLVSSLFHILSLVHPKPSRPTAIVAPNSGMRNDVNTAGTCIEAKLYAAKELYQRNHQNHPNLLLVAPHGSQHTRRLSIATYGTLIVKCLT